MLSSRKSRALLSLIGLLAIFCIAAAVPSLQKVTKQVGGTSGDSAVAAADTSVAWVIRKDISNLWVDCGNDSSTFYTIQVSADSTVWLNVDTLTVPAGWLDASTDLEDNYANFGWLRVIQDADSASEFGAAWIRWIR